VVQQLCSSGSSTGMGQLRYLPFIVPFMVAEVLGAIWIVWKLSSRCDCSCGRRVSNGPDETTMLMPEEQLNAQNMSFQNTYKCCIGVKSQLASVCLAIFRAACFGYFFGVGVIWNLIRSGGWQYFTNWNLILISIYYFSALTSSVIGIRFGNRDDAEWSRRVRRLGYAVHILFEVVGGTALLVTVVDFTLLNPEFTFWNASQHFATMLSLMIELCVNCLPVRMDHFSYNALWASLYLVFIWPVVGSGARRHWPYDFLDLSGPSCFLWYTGLLLADILFYCLWVLLYRFKVYMYIHVLGLGKIYGENDIVSPKDACTDNALLAGEEYPACLYLCGALHLYMLLLAQKWQMVSVVSC
jgi:hypothetical protein